VIIEDSDMLVAIRGDTRNDENYPKPLPAFQLFSISVFSFSFYPAYISPRQRPSSKLGDCSNSNIAARRVTLLYQKISGYFLKVLEEAGVRVSTDPLLALRE
jgi:hypothetical protein